jgi:hypothetical protein
VLAAGLGPQEPFFYSVASNLHRVLHLTRPQQLSIWRRVLDLYGQANRMTPKFLQLLCEPLFVEELMENEVFWGMVGVQVNRAFYAHATDFLPAVYAISALMAAHRDGLPLTPEDRSILTGAV